MRYVQNVHTLCSLTRTVKGKFASWASFSSLPSLRYLDLGEDERPGHLLGFLRSSLSAKNPARELNTDGSTARKLIFEKSFDADGWCLLCFEPCSLEGEEPSGPDGWVGEDRGQPSRDCRPPAPWLSLASWDITDSRSDNSLSSEDTRSDMETKTNKSFVEINQHLILCPHLSFHWESDWVDCLWTAGGWRCHRWYSPLCMSSCPPSDWACSVGHWVSSCLMRVCN